MRVLVGCEFSGAVRDAFAARGWEAWSCDLLPSETPGNHFQGDVREMLAQQWDLLCAFPPCTYLCSSGMHWTTRGLRDPQLTEDSLAFVRLLLGADIPHIALENPVGAISTRIRKPDQIVQPYQFGENASKSTCLWLKGIPKLIPTKFIEPQLACPECRQLSPYGSPWCAHCPEGEGGKLKPVWGNQTVSGQNKLSPSDARAKKRSKTYAGLAAAMAAQWGSYLQAKPPAPTPAPAPPAQD